MPSNDHNYVMSPETAEAVRGLLNVCGDTDEVQPTQQANRGQSQGSPVQRAGRRCCMRIIEARKAPVLWARQDQVTTTCCGNHTC